MTFTRYPDTRLSLAQDSLAGLSVGDALGSQYFVPGNTPADLTAARLPPPPWQWTDDTEMACSVVAALAENGRVDRDALALAFAERCEPYRGYGPGAVRILRLVRTGTPWPVAASLAARARRDGDRPAPARLLAGVAAALDPATEVHHTVRRVARLLDRPLPGSWRRSATARGSPHRTPSPSPCGWPPCT